MLRNRLASALALALIPVAAWAWFHGGGSGGNPAPPVISNINANPSSTSAVVSWTTTTNSNSLVNYGLTTGYGSSQSNGSLLTSHSVTLTSLTAATLYHFDVCSTDAFSQQSCSGDNSFTTTGTGSTAPVISAAHLVPTGTTTATVLWTTDAASNSNVNYGATTAYGSSQSDSSNVIAHSINLTGLTAGAILHYQVQSSNGTQSTGIDLSTRMPSSVYASCNPTTVSLDGCSGAMAAGLSGASFQSTGFFTTTGPGNALQSQQTYQTASFNGTITGANTSSPTLTINSGLTGTVNVNSHLDTIQGRGIAAGVWITAGSGTTWLLSGPVSAGATVGPETMTTLFRPTYNVPGVDYPVGIPSGFTLANPNTLPTCSGTSVPICLPGGTGNQVNVYSSGDCINTGSGTATCSADAHDLDIEGYDFTLNGSYTIFIENGVSIPGNLIFRDNKFTFGSAYQPPSGALYVAYGTSSTTFQANSAVGFTPGGTTIAEHNDFDMGADTGGTTVAQSQAGQVFNFYDHAANDEPIAEYNYFANFNPRLTFAHGAVFKFNVVRNVNYNTANHGEATALNQKCPSFFPNPVGDCFNPTIWDAEDGLSFDDSTYCGGQTAPFFLGGGVWSPQIMDVTAKNNVVVDNYCAINITSITAVKTGCTGGAGDGANCQIAFTTVDGGGGSGVGASESVMFPGSVICTAPSNASARNSCGASLGANISGFAQGAGTWRFSGSLSGVTAGAQLWLLGFSPGAGYYMTGDSYRNIDSENNYVDMSAVQEIPGIGDCAVSSESMPHTPNGSLVSTGNWRLAGGSDGTLSFTPCNVQYCPYLDQAASDGCYNAVEPTGNSIENANFFTGYAQQSSQSLTGPNFTASISGGVLTVTAGTGTLMAPYDTIAGTGVPAGIRLASPFGGSGCGGTCTGAGNTGTYALVNATNRPQLPYSVTVGSETMNAVHRPYWDVAGVDYPIGADYTATAASEPINASFGQTFAGAISGGVLTVTNISNGGALLAGATVAAGVGASTGVTAGISIATPTGFTASGAQWMTGANITSGGTGASYGASLSGTLTWSGSGCGINPVVNVATTSGGALSTVTLENAGDCTTVPSTTATTWTAGGLLSGSGASFTLTNSGTTITGASVNTAGSGYSPGTPYTQGNPGLVGTMTWAGAGCSVNPVLNVQAAAAGFYSTILAPGTGIASVIGVANGGNCASIPSSSATTWTPGGLSAGSGAEITLTHTTAGDGIYNLLGATGVTIANEAMYVPQAPVYWDGSEARSCSVTGLEPEQEVLCTGGSYDLYVNRNDFGVSTGQCIQLQVTNWTGPVWITNSQFRNSSPNDASNACNGAHGMLYIDPTTVTGKVTIWTDYFDGADAAYATSGLYPADMIDIPGSSPTLGALDFHHNLVTNVPDVGVFAQSCNGQTFAFDYFGPINDSAIPPTTGSFYRGGMGGSSPCVGQTFSYDVFYQSIGMHGVTALLDISPGSNDTLGNATLIDVDHSVFATNIGVASAKEPIALTMGNYAAGTLSFLNNDFDPSGLTAGCSGFGAQFPIGAINSTGNLVMLNGTEYDLLHEALTGSVNVSGSLELTFSAFAGAIGPSSLMEVVGASPSGLNSSYGANSTTYSISAGTTGSMTTSNAFAAWSSGGTAWLGNADACDGL